MKVCGGKSSQIHPWETNVSLIWQEIWVYSKEWKTDNRVYHSQNITWWRLIWLKISYLKPAKKVDFTFRVINYATARDKSVWNCVYVLSICTKQTDTRFSWFILTIRCFLNKKTAAYHCTAAIFLQSYDTLVLPGYVKFCKCVIYFF